MKQRSFDIPLWRTWAVEFPNPLGAQLASPIAPITDTCFCPTPCEGECIAAFESLPLVWRDRRTAIGQCAQNCGQTPGDECGCGVHGYTSIDTFWLYFKGITDHKRDRRRPTTPRARAFSFGTAVGKVRPDRWPEIEPDALRAEGYSVLALFVWPEDADIADALQFTYGIVPIVLPWSPVFSIATMAAVQQEWMEQAAESRTAQS